MIHQEAATKFHGERVILSDPPAVSLMYLGAVVTDYRKLYPAPPARRIAATLEAKTVRRTVTFFMVAPWVLRHRASATALILREQPASQY